jgi:hypothetical protein
MRHLSTCGRCGGTIEWYESPDPHIRGTQWRHVSATPGGHTHNPDPDDGYVAGPEPEEREPCPACGHVHDSLDDEDECGELVGTGLYGSDGVEVTRVCICTGPAETVATVAVPDPWTDPDAAAAAVPPPF